MMVAVGSMIAVGSGELSPGHLYSQPEKHGEPLGAANGVSQPHDSSHAENMFPNVPTFF